MKFRKKPVVVEAFQWNGRTLAQREAFLEETGLPHFPLGSRRGQVGLLIPTLEGLMVASDGDWIIKGVKGEFYPCKPDIFEMTYEPVEE